MTADKIQKTIDFIYSKKKKCIFCSQKPVCLIHFKNPTTKNFENAYWACIKHQHIILKFDDLIKVADASKAEPSWNE